MRPFSEQLTPPAFVTMVDIEVNDIDHLYLTDQPGGVTFGGVSYDPYPYSPPKLIKGSQLPRATLTLANVNRMFTPLMTHADDLRLRPVTFYYTFEDYLDVPPAQSGFDQGWYYTQTLIIDSVEITNDSATLILVTGLDFMGTTLPKNKYYKDYCRFVFKDTRCAYAGAEDTCNLSFARCKELNNEDRFGGFRSTGTSFFIR